MKDTPLLPNRADERSNVRQKMTKKQKYPPALCHKTSNNATSEDPPGAPCESRRHGDGTRYRITPPRERLAIFRWCSNGGAGTHKRTNAPHRPFYAMLEMCLRTSAATASVSGTANQSKDGVANDATKGRERAIEAGFSETVASSRTGIISFV